MAQEKRFFFHHEQSERNSKAVARKKHVPSSLNRWISVALSTNGSLGIKMSYGRSVVWGLARFKVAFIGGPMQHGKN